MCSVGCLKSQCALRCLRKSSLTPDKAAKLAELDGHPLPPDPSIIDRHRMAALLERPSLRKPDHHSRTWTWRAVLGVEPKYSFPLLTAFAQARHVVGSWHITSLSAVQRDVRSWGQNRKWLAHGQNDAIDPIPTFPGVVKQAEICSQVVLPCCTPSDAGATVRRLSFPLGLGTARLHGRFANENRIAQPADWNRCARECRFRGHGPNGRCAQDRLAARHQMGAAPASLPPGAELAVLYGDPSKEGLFAMRLKGPKVITFLRIRIRSRKSSR